MLVPELSELRDCLAQLISQHLWLMLSVGVLALLVEHVGHRELWAGFWLLGKPLVH